MNEFKTFHPIVNFIYFVSVIIFAMFVMHPICLAISLITGVWYLFALKGRGAAGFVFTLVLPMLLLCAVINPIFNHGGETILAYFPGGNPLTLESLIFGLATGVMIAGVVCWFACYGEVMTSDKFIYIFGRIMPSLSLVFSMVLRFIPRFNARFKELVSARRGIDCSLEKGNLVKKIKTGVKLLSSMITWSLESSVQTADSMKSRGYGLKGRTAFSNFVISKRDVAAIVYILALDVYIIIGIILGGLKYLYFPSLDLLTVDIYRASICTVYGFLFLTPMFAEATTNSVLDIFR